MRILSQDGKFDFPYERVCLEVTDSGKIFAQGDIWGATAEDNFIEVATYGNEAKARKAMEMLREEYAFEKQFEIICSGATDYPSKPTYYFQFPADDEVEV